jgi:hypothetical protein
MNLKRIWNFLKKDKRYVFFRLLQEFNFRINKIRYKYPQFLVKQYMTSPLNFFSSLHSSATLKDKSLLKVADRIESQTFDLLGSGIKTLDPINWSLDFKSDFCWTKKYCHDYDYNDLHLGNDVKVPWELSRLQFLPLLAQAHIISKDKKYLDKIEWYLKDWIKQNPFAYSINWACTMDVALRAISILLTLDLLKVNHLDTSRFSFVNDQLYLHGLFVYENLEKSDINGNHYLADLVGLLSLSVFFKKEDWKRVALKELDLEVSRQTLEDGADFEGSLPYHRLVLELFFMAYWLCKKNGIEVSSNFSDQLVKMFIFVSRYLKPTGQCPVIGDNDNGRAFILGTEDLNDHRYLVEIGQSVFPSSQMLNFPVSTDYCLWLGIQEPSVSREFSESWFSSNYLVDKNKEDYLFVEMSPIGLGGRGGHGHSDTASFELMIKGKDVVIDSGCYSYTSDYKRRNNFRRTEAHNIIQIDDEELFPFFNEKNLWNLKNSISSKSIRPIENGFEIQHDGYKCHYTRSFMSLLGNSYLIEDKLSGLRNKKVVTSRFHLHPKARAEVISPSKILISHEDLRVSFDLRSNVEFSLKIESCEISFYFGKLESSTCIVISSNVEGIMEIQLSYEIKGN